jgi:hypothetical protein
MSRVVHLHIGAPKTGTTYVQNRLSANAEELARHGVLYPGRGMGDPSTFHFRAALDLLGQDWGGPKGHAKGAWRQMTRRVNRHPGSAIISHEILAPADSGRVARLMHDLRRAEVHVVYGARDLGRQLPAAWQESIKQGRRWPFSRFLDEAEAGNTWFAQAFDLPAVLSTWGQFVPADRIHVVTVPHDTRTRPNLLWERFCAALDLDRSWAPQDTGLANESLGIIETQLIRRLNGRMGRGLRREAAYDDLILRLLAREELAERRRSDKVTLPPERYDFAEAQCKLWIDWLEQSGVEVFGDVKELLPRRPAPGTPWVNPDKVEPRPLLKASLDALEVMTHEAAARQESLGRRVRRKLGHE